MQEIKLKIAVKNIVDYLNSNPTHRIYPNTPLHIEAMQALSDNETINQQYLTFKVAASFEQGIDCRYANTDILINAYEIESWLHTAIEANGLKLVIADLEKYKSTLGKPFEI